MSTKDSGKAIDKFRRYCREKKLRYTPERELIIKEVYRRDRHFDVDELFISLRSQTASTKVSKASIYRALPHLIAAGLLREVMTRDGHGCYEHTLGHAHHDHMYCLGCGKISEFVDESIEAAQEKVARTNKFKIIKHTHVLEGYCRSCVKNGKDAN